MKRESHARTGTVKTIPTPPHEHFLCADHTVDMPRIGRNVSTQAPIDWNVFIKGGGLVGASVNLENSVGSVTSVAEVAEVAEVRGCRSLV